MRHAIRGMVASDLADKDSERAASFLTAASDDLFWERSRLLKRFCEPLLNFSAWVRGCDCHEDERKRGLSVECSWAGCRAPRLASRVQQTMDAFENLRGDLSAFVDLVSAITCSAGMFHVKMEWVHKEPYTIWQAFPWFVAIK